MNGTNRKFKLSCLVVALASAFVAMSAYADDEEAAALKRPSNSLEVGATNATASSAKFGEYNGLNKSGFSSVGNLSVRGGGAYSANESGATDRWSFTGTDLGSTSRELGANFGNQGNWSAGFGYDELTHNLSDSYQTPYFGTNGGNSFTLGSFGVVPLAAVAGVPAAGSTSLSTAQLQQLHNLDISTTRKNTKVNIDVKVDARLNVFFDFNHLDQSGAKLQGFGSNKVGSNASSNEVVSILPMPTNYQTDTINLGVNWIGEKGNLMATYSGSFFNDGYNKVGFDTWGVASETQYMTTPPSNVFQQLSLAGGYAVTPTTKLTSNVSVARNTQNETFVASPLMYPGFVMPATSLGGVVANTHADLKVSDHTLQNLDLSAAVRYDQRDNQTPSNIYDFSAISGNGTSAGNVGNRGTYPNTPLSTKKTRFEFAGDYRIKANQHFRVELDHEDVNRWCNNYAVNAVYLAGSNCVVATSSQEDKLDTSYRIKANEDVDFKVGYSYAKRNTNSDVNARAAFISTNGIALPVASVPAGSAGLNAGDFRGFYPYFDASRIEQAVKFGGNWQATEKLSLLGSFKYTDDAYDSAYGVKNGNSWSVNLDANYAVSDKESVYGYLTQQHRQRDLTDIYANKTAATLPTTTALGYPAFATWTNKLTDDDITLAFGAKQSGLMGGKLEMTAEVSYTLGQTLYGSQYNFTPVVTTGTVVSQCSSPTILSCGNLPTISSETSQLKVTGTYQIDKSSKFVVRYVYQALTASDYFYNGYQYGSTASSLMPTNQSAGTYTDNVVSFGYVHNF